MKIDFDNIIKLDGDNYEIIRNEANKLIKSNNTLYNNDVVLYKDIKNNLYYVIKGVSVLNKETNENLDYRFCDNVYVSRLDGEIL